MRLDPLPKFSTLIVRDNQSLRVTTTNKLYAGSLRVIEDKKLDPHGTAKHSLEE